MKMHIGKEIEQKFQESGLKLPVFADKINTGERNVYSIFKREDISADMLRKISEVLGYDFFSLYQQHSDLPLVNEPMTTYQRSEQSVNMGLSLVVSKNEMKNFASFFEEMQTIAHKYGILIL
jgi:plasmid maintenance system antidote protein VapI